MEVAMRVALVRTTFVMISSSQEVDKKPR